MKYIIKKSFYKSLPKHDKGHIYSKIDKFVESHNIYNKTGTWPVGASVYKIEGVNKNNIYKFRVDKSSRILFTYTSNINTNNVDDYNRIVILEYCNHDSQIRRAKNLNIYSDSSYSLQDSKEDDIDTFIEQNYKDYAYLPDDDIYIEVYEDDEIHNLIEANSKDAIYYLSSEQRKSIQENNLPLLVTGCAGSGKTTVTINKVYRLINLYKDCRIGYFTYSQILKKEVQNMFVYLCEKKDNKNYINNVDFFNMDELKSIVLEENNLYSYVKFFQFEQWLNEKYKYNKNYNTFNSRDVYREIRGIIKGMIGIDWEVNKSNTKYNEIQSIVNQVMMDRKSYVQLPEGYSIFNKRDREKVYDICENYNSWLKENNKVDENDISRMLLSKVEEGKLDKYDYIVVDEVQDLTEKQLFTLINITKYKENIIFSGDYNQTINPTYFNSTRIKTLFEYKYNIDSFKNVSLTNNYRNCSSIVELANRVSELRTIKVGKNKRNDYIEVAKRKDDAALPFFLSKSELNEEMLLSIANKRHYVSIVVANEEEKQKLKDTKNISDNVFTISEIKGIEKKYIVCYNIISHYNHIWENILKNTYLSDNYLYRNYFNMFYVAITRARDNICFYEEKQCGLYTYIDDVILKIKKFDEHILKLSEKSTKNDYLKEAKYYEEKEAYEQAISLYRKVDNYEARISIKRCEALILKNKGNYKLAGDILYSISEYEIALDCYYSINDKKNALKCIIRVSKTWEQLVNKSKDIKLDPIKFMFENLQDDTLCMDEFMKLYNKEVSKKLISYEENINIINDVLKRI